MTAAEIDLATVADFRLGAVLVRPSYRYDHESRIPAGGGPRRCDSADPETSIAAMPFANLSGVPPR